ncbi:Anp1-domain-containing protein [Lipomyces chichibuensis]|uniref:Anp1-domain-containing protein n=1 Tax=Lipomyces chichibuensis TaxID=1546026 RepID=UPI0033431E46
MRLDDRLQKSDNRLSIRSPIEPQRYRYSKCGKPIYVGHRRKQVILAIFAGLLFFTTFHFLSGESLFSGPSSYDAEALNLHVYDLANSQATRDGATRGDRVLLCIPLRDAANHLPLMFSHLRNLTYPHSLLDLSFLVSDSKDRTREILDELLLELQLDEDPYMHYNGVEIFEKDFGQIIGQGFSDRHGFAAQGPRRKLMGKARNWLLTSALKPEHSWVYWRDADIERAPVTIIEDLMKHDKDVIVPSMDYFDDWQTCLVLTSKIDVWRPLPEWLGGEQPYDLNSWQESEAALRLAEQLPEDEVIVEGYAEYATWRPHLAYAREANGDTEQLVDLDGVGGVSILAKANVFRAGAHFPGFAFLNHAETEGFGKMSRSLNFTVAGLPHYVIWHIFEPSEDDQKLLKEKQEESKAKQKEKVDSGKGDSDATEDVLSPRKQASQDRTQKAEIENTDNLVDVSHLLPGH